MRIVLKSKSALKFNLPFDRKGSFDLNSIFIEFLFIGGFTFENCISPDDEQCLKPELSIT